MNLMLRKPESQFIYANPIQHKSQAPTFVAFLPVSQTGVLSSQFGEVCAQLYTYLCLVQPSVVAEFGKICIYTIRGKASCTPTQVAKDTRYCLQRLQSLSRSVQNSTKTSYTLIRFAKARLQVSTCTRTQFQEKLAIAYTLTQLMKAGYCVFKYCNSRHNSRKTSYAFSSQFSRIVILMQCKI